LTELLCGKDLDLFRGDRCLFQGLEFALNTGELLFVEGANGSGKTSLLRSIAGLLEFERGEIRWQGLAVAEDPQRFRAALVWFAHRPGFKGDLTPIQNLHFESGLRSFRSEDIDAALARVGVSASSALPMRSLSAGQQRRVGLARMILSAAPLWLMDEPFTNLDKDGHALVTDLVNEHLAADGACVLASHQAVSIEAPTHRITL